MAEEQAAVAKELERLRLRQRQAYEQTTDLIDKLIAILTVTKGSLHAAAPMHVDSDAATAPAPSPPAPLLAPMMKQVQELQVAQKLSAEQKELNAAIARVVKAVERGYPVDVPDFLFEHPALNVDTLAEVVLHHLMKTGRTDSARLFAAAAKLPLDPSQFAELAELRAVLAALDAGDLAPPIAWCDKRRQALDSARSPLLFQLHRGAFVQLLTADRIAALAYARRHLAPLSVYNQKEVRRLFCSLAFASRLAASPYRDLHWADVHRELCASMRAAVASVFGLSVDSALGVALEAGLVALPPHVKVHGALKSKPSADLAVRIPVEVEVPREQRFHSVFTCPVSREQTVPDNPPMLLQCGHVIARTSMLKLARGASQRFKCPYCPVEQTVAGATQVDF